MQLMSKHQATLISEECGVTRIFWFLYRVFPTFGTLHRLLLRVQLVDIGDVGLGLHGRRRRRRGLRKRRSDRGLWWGRRCRRQGRLCPVANGFAVRAEARALTGHYGRLHKDAVLAPVEVAHSGVTVRHGLVLATQLVHKTLVHTLLRAHRPLQLADARRQLCLPLLLGSLLAPFKKPTANLPMQGGGGPRGNRSQRGEQAAVARHAAPPTEDHPL